MRKRLFTLLGDALAIPFIILAILAGIFWVLGQMAFDAAEPERNED